VTASADGAAVAGSFTVRGPASGARSGLTFLSRAWGLRAQVPGLLAPPSLRSAPGHLEGGLHEVHHDAPTDSLQRTKRDIVDKLFESVLVAAACLKPAHEAERFRGPHGLASRALGNGLFFITAPAR